MKERVMSLINKFTRINGRDENSKIDDLGFDSLDIVELLIDLEKEFSIQIDDEEFSQVVTIGDIINIVDKFKSIK